MIIDVESLRDRHPRLLPETVDNLTLNVAVALDRRHQPGVTMGIDLFGLVTEARVSWRSPPTGAATMLDRKRVTELGAEAIALVIVHEARGWVASRRLQEGEFADWLLVDRNGQKVALEVSGTDGESVEARIREKLAQVAKCEAGEMRAACVVRFLEPTTLARDYLADRPG